MIPLGGRFPYRYCEGVPLPLPPHPRLSLHVQVYVCRRSGLIIPYLYFRAAIFQKVADLITGKYRIQSLAATMVGQVLRNTKIPLVHSFPICDLLVLPVFTIFIMMILVPESFSPATTASSSSSIIIIIIITTIVINHHYNHHHHRRHQSSL